MNKCLLKHKDLGIGHGKECCCICSHIFEAEYVIVPKNGLNLCSNRNHLSIKIMVE
jgi:hypothetical protein